MVAQLLDDRFAPITSEIGFLESTAEAAKEAFVAWQRPIHANRGVRIECREIHGDFVSKISALLPLTNIERRRTLFLPTRGKWTAYFDNGWRGADSFSAVSYLCQKLGCYGLRAVSTPDTFRRTGAGIGGRYGSTIFELYAPTAEGCSFLNTRRSIFAANDGGRWKFGGNGEPLEFEETKQYTAQRIQDRFTPEMLDRYLKRLGIQYFAPEFYDMPQPAWLVSKEGPCAAGLKEYTLEEARSHF
jgi:hypothetical protein